MEPLQNVAGHYRSVTEPLRDVTEALREHYRTLQSVTGCYGSVTEALQGVAEHYGALWRLAGRYRTLREHYGAFTECYRTITESIDFAYH